MEKYYIAIVVFAAVLAALKFISAIWNSQGIRKVKPSLFMPGYELFYSDKKSGGVKEGVIYSQLLYSEKHGLQGKPDMVYKNKSGTKMIPVELKSGSIKNAAEPHEGDLMQLAAYFAILEDIYGVKPKKGLLIYRNCMFKVKNGRKLRKKLNAALENMRIMLETGIGEAEPGFMKCKHCMCRGTVCEYND